MENEHFKQKNQKIVFFGWLWTKKMFLFAEMAFFEKWASTLCVRKVKNRAFSLQPSVFGKWSFFAPIQSHQTLQKYGFQQAQGKTQNGTFGCKSAILGRGLERGFTICDT